MNHQSQIEPSSVISIVQQQDTEIVAAKLNSILSDRGIRAKVALKNAYLGILLEATEVPPREQLIDLIQQQTQEYSSESIKAIRIYGRKIAQVTPQWCEEIEFKQSAPSNYNLLSLTDWLSQGMEAPNFSSFDKQHLFVERDVQKFLRFHFSPNSTALLSLSKIKEVLNIPSVKVHPVPHAADCLLGIYDYRGEILWLSDLGQQLGLTPSIDSVDFNNSALGYAATGINSGSTNTLTVIVIQNQEKSLGIVVPKVIDIEMHALQEMQPASEELFSPQILPFLQGYLIRSSSPVLDPIALIEDSQLQNLSDRSLSLG